MRADTRFNIDLSDVPPQLQILKNKECIKEGSSNYTGVTINKAANKKWQAQIRIDGKKRRIGSYMNEEEAAIDVARAIFKYKGQEAPNEARKRKKSAPAIVIDLSDVPSQLPIPKSKGYIKEGSSKYAGACFDKSSNKWEAQIMIEGRQYSIGCVMRSRCLPLLIMREQY